jgi:hypothetical protein
MKIDWCWACKREHPMLDEAEFAAVWRAYQEAERMLYPLSTPNESPRERLLKLQASSELRERPAGLNIRQIRFRPLQDAYENVTALKFEGDDPKMIMHYRTSFYGPPCPYCGRLLRNRRASQCFVCGMDWHDPNNVINRKQR